MASARASFLLACSFAAAGAALSGCGSRSALGDGAPEDTGADPDAGVEPEPPVDPECEAKPPPDGASCQPLDFTMAVRASCTLGVEPGAVFDAEGLLTAVEVGERVLALDRWGAGHLLASCDSTMASVLWDRFDVEGYLGQTEAPKVASAGNFFPCDPATGKIDPYDSLPPTVTYLGEDLPAFYEGAPDLLAADWDAIILCGKGVVAPLSTWQDELKAYVTDHGKGLMVIMDYHAQASEGWLFDEMNAVIEGSGLVFEKVFLHDDELAVCACVPGLPPPP